MTADPITVYLLWHMPGDPEKCEDKDALLLGVYSSEQNALARIESARRVEGFRDHPDGFQITPMTLDKDEWVEGFATYHYELPEPLDVLAATLAGNDDELERFGAMSELDWEAVAMRLAGLIRDTASGEPTALRTLADTIETANSPEYHWKPGPGEPPRRRAPTDG